MLLCFGRYLMLQKCTLRDTKTILYPWAPLSVPPIGGADIEPRIEAHTVVLRARTACKPPELLPPALPPSCRTFCTHTICELV